MTLYKCHHIQDTVILDDNIQDTVILDDNIISYLAYLLCWNEKNCKIDSQQVTDNQNKVQKPSSDGSQKTADTPNHILNWSTYCATTNQRNQCSKETCTIFPICKFKEVRK
jgi:hypothetical protein